MSENSEVKDETVSTDIKVGTKEGTVNVVNTNVEGDKDGVVTNEVKDDTTVETDTKDDNIMIPKTRFDDINDKYKNAVNELNRLKEANEKPVKTEETVTETPEVDDNTIDTTNQELQKQVEKYETLLTGMYEQKVKDIPEDMQDLIPEGLSTEDKISWIDKANEKGLFKKETNVVVGQPLNHSANESEEEAYKKMNPLQRLASFYSQNK